MYRRTDYAARITTSVGKVPTPRLRSSANTLTGRSEEDDPGAEAIRRFQRAESTEQRPAFDPFDLIQKPHDVRNDRNEGNKLLELRGDASTTGHPHGSEVMERDVDAGNGLTTEQRGLELYILDTLEAPTTITTGASQLRLEAAARLGILQPAIDAAQTAQATNSLEKMLCHQMAALHHAAMNLMGRAVGDGAFPPLDPAIVTRYTNAAARLMETYQSGMLALLKFKTGGKRTVVVQHVTVSDGGQAVIAGSVTKQGGDGKTGGRRPKMKAGPDNKRRGWLKNGNPPGDYMKAPRCGAKLRKREAFCRCPAMRNGRCRLHGGLSTGPKTSEGRERCRQAATTHGFYSQRAKLEQRRARMMVRKLRELLAGLRL